MPLILETRPLADLVPAPYNPRRQLSAPAAAKLRASLATFGLVEPLVWNRRTGYVVGGHARLGILRELGVETVPVSVVDLTEAQERALNVVLNNREAQGRFDPAKLAELLAELEPLPELTLTGFTAQDLAALRFEPAAAEQPNADPPATIEVTLRFTEASYTAVGPVLDAWAAAGVGLTVRR